MKALVTICRWLVGLLFIFSGMVKANDPLGLSYKMLEFFEKWNLHIFDNYSLAFALIINVLEVVAGVGIIIGWKPKFFSRLLLLLILFFTFLTSYVLFSGKIHACGCFGDCIPLTPIQTFTKDIILLVLVIIILMGVTNVNAIINKKQALLILGLTVLVVSLTQNYVLQHLPFKDCLAYKVGNNIINEMKPPAGSLPDSFAIFYNYKKDGKTIHINAEHFPDDFDSTYEQIGEEEKVLIRKGNNTAKIANFSLTTLNGTDTTQAILNQNGKIAFLFVKDFSAIGNEAKAKCVAAIDNCYKNEIPVYIVTNDREGAIKANYNNAPIFICDATEIKTAARVNPTFMLLQKGLVLKKVAGNDADKLLH